MLLNVASVKKCIHRVDAVSRISLHRSNIKLPENRKLYASKRLYEHSNGLFKIMRIYQTIRCSKKKIIDKFKHTLNRTLLYTDTRNTIDHVEYYNFENNKATNNANNVIWNAKKSLFRLFTILAVRATMMRDEDLAKVYDRTSFVVLNRHLSYDLTDLKQRLTHLVSLRFKLISPESKIIFSHTISSQLLHQKVILEHVSQTFI